MPTPQSDSVSEVVIGVLNTGVWPESKSFNDTDLGPVPSTWKGICQEGTNFNVSNCNRKLIGAHYFAKGYEAMVEPIDETNESKSARDDDGHDTHTSTITAGAAVQGASLLGYASGVALGMVTRAMIATYKVCWVGGCFSSNILAVREQAIIDNVNVLSMLLGGGMADYHRDSVAIGAFATMEKGIFVSCSTGNAWPNSFTVFYIAPCITTVGAGTIDCDFPAYVQLENGKNFSGVSLFKGDMLPDKPVLFIYACNASTASNEYKRSKL
ncbi:hypothetical protein QQ045_021442 [Rhodiola kirilowii]